MSKLPSLMPALNSRGEIVSPEHASKTDSYSCLFCKQKLSFKQCNVRRSHFSHLPSSECNFFGNGGESDIHKNAKIIVEKYLLAGSTIIAILTCKECKKKTMKSITVNTLSQKVIQEYSHNTPEGNKIFDIGIEENGKCLFAIEICYTHRQKDRPVDWYEFRAEDIINCLFSGIEDIREDRICGDCKTQRAKIQCQGRCFSREKGIYKKIKRCDGKCELIQCPICGNRTPQFKLLNKISACSICLDQDERGEDCIRCKRRGHKYHECFAKSKMDSCRNEVPLCNFKLKNDLLCTKEVKERGMICSLH